MVLFPLVIAANDRVEEERKRKGKREREK